MGTAALVDQGGTVEVVEVILMAGIPAGPTIPPVVELEHPGRLMPPGAPRAMAPEAGIQVTPVQVDIQARVVEAVAPGVPVVLAKPGHGQERVELAVMELMNRV